MDDQGPKGWYSRGYLPHFDGGEMPQLVTFGLVDAVPAQRIEEWREQLRLVPDEQAKAILRRRIDRHLDRGYGRPLLRTPQIAEVAQQAFLHFDGDRYRLSAWVVMPNHVHVLCTPDRDHRLPDIVHSWKSFTAHEANRLLGRTGSFWHRDFWDRFLRDERHLRAAVSYIEWNPVQAGLCARQEEWPFSSANPRFRSVP
ncbi:MAG: transposase [Armatimonadetes bacterium]|nr:transposase [Armatimonadota bacterium]